MRNLQYYKRILAGVACATVLMSNLGGNSQVVFAAEESEFASEGQAPQEATAEEPAPEPAAEESAPEEEIATTSLEEEAPAVEETPVTEEPTQTTETPTETTEAPAQEPAIEITEYGSTGEEHADEASHTETAAETSTEASTESKTEEVAENASTETKVEDGSTDTAATEEAPKAEETTETKTVDESKELICTEDHEHTDACYKTKDETTEESKEESKPAHDELWYYIHELDCKEEHEHTDACYKVVRELKCEQVHEHTKDCYQQIEEVLFIEEDGDFGSVVYTATTAGVLVKAEAAESALPEGATLHAQRIESERDLEKVSEELDKSDVDYDDYLALDVYFENKDGKEIEPSGSVQVTFELEDSVLPEDANTESLSVQHFDESGSKTDVVTVADTANDSDGNVQTESNAVKAEFEVKSFSTFTITWSSNGKTTAVTVKCVDEDGNELSVFPENLEDIGTTKGFQLTNANSFKLDSTMKEKLAIDGYTFVSAYTDDYTDVTGIKASYVGTGYKRWKYEITGKNWWGTSGTYTEYSAPTLYLKYKNSTADARFYIIVDGGGTIPKEDGQRTDGKSGEYNYTSRFYREKAIIDATGLTDNPIYDDNDGAQIVTKNNSTYADNKVVANLAVMPSNADIVEKINADTRLAYTLKIENGMIVVDDADARQGGYTINDLRDGDILYVNWYVMKDVGDHDKEDGGYHVDGELIIKEHRAIVVTDVDVNALPYVATSVAIMVGAMFMLINYKSRRIR